MGSEHFVSGHMCAAVERPGILGCEVSPKFFHEVDPVDVRQRFKPRPQIHLPVTERDINGEDNMLG